MTDPRAARKEMLDRAVADYAARGWHVETRSDHQATLAKGKRVSHLLHLILTFFTLGVWALVWITVTLTGGVKRRLIEIAPSGNVVETKI